MRTSGNRSSEPNGLFHEPSVDSEFYFQWHITDRCNRRCAHCYQASFDGSRELPREGLLQVVDRMHQALEGWGLHGALSITGGEPLARAGDVLAILDACAVHDRIHRVDVLTNGDLLDDGIIAELGRRPAFRRVQVSLEAASASVHDAIRGAGSFENVVAAISRAKRHGVPVAVMMTLSRRNVHELPAVLRLLEELFVDVLSVDRFIPEGQSASLGSWTLSAEEVHAAYAQCHSL